MKIKYPLILLNMDVAFTNGLVLTISKSVISFSSDRYKGNLESVNDIFCDSNGNIFVLRSIDIINRDYSVKNFLWNGFKFQSFVKYNFQSTGEKIELEMFRKLAIALMKLEITENMWDNGIKRIENAANFKDIIDYFFIGRQE